ncbi:hypothetical protein ABIB37_002742 [Agrococcus sp. UYP10]|uniref:hypothetical protein n=1 Tax=Agrococcus sp. UYP10 TaxID=1756355 RepID=UPI0033987524
MSTAAVQSHAAIDLRPLPTAERPERERHLRALPAIAPRRAPRLVHGIVGLVGLAGIIVAQLGLSVVISEGAYQLSALQGESTALARTEQTLAEEIAVLSSPQHVAVAADELGMLAGQPSQFLTLGGAVTAGGPDALHMQVPAVDQFGMHVPNALLAEAPQAAATVQQVQAAAVRPHPGMLLPAGVSAAAAPAAAEAADQPAPGTLLPTTTGE